jgi:hypothetical protein
MRYEVVTSMSQAGYDLYGRSFLTSYQKYWNAPLTVYTEDPLEDERFPVRDLNEDDELMGFLAECSEESPVDYRFQAGRFAKKVFAITGHPRNADWLIWLDADVETFSKVDDGFLSRVCPEGYPGSYLGRKDWNHSECGWVAYNLNHYGSEFLDRFREVYTSGEIWDHAEWHDSYIFDRVREEKSDWLNLSKGIPGMHPWDSTALGEKMKHLKGPLRKKGKQANVPEQYWSEKEHEQKARG